MVKRFPFFRYVLFAGLLALPRGIAWGSEPPAQPSSQEPSLGEKARELRAKTSQEGKKPTKVYTNDDLRTGGEGISVLGGGSSAAAPSGPTEATAEKHDEQHYRHVMNELQARLDLHRRQLEVLQQKLSINQLQYYPDPYKTLKQEYSRSDINRLQQEIDVKKEEVRADERAVADLETRLRREGGNPGWLRLAPGGETALEKQESKEAGQVPKGKPSTREYWQSRFKSARAKLAKAQETQQLTEDELNLLQIQQAREVLNTNVAAEVGQKIAAKQAEVDSARAATDKAAKALEQLQQEFASSGAPPEWSEEQ